MHTTDGGDRAFGRTNYDVIHGDVGTTNDDRIADPTTSKKLYPSLPPLHVIIRLRRNDPYVNFTNHCVLYDLLCIGDNFTLLCWGGGKWNMIGLTLSSLRHDHLLGFSCMCSFSQRNC